MDTCPEGSIWQDPPFELEEWADICVTVTIFNEQVNLKIFGLK
jgi:hypothetical protein